MYPFLRKPWLVQHSEDEPTCGMGDNRSGLSRVSPSLAVPLGYASAHGLCTPLPTLLQAMRLGWAFPTHLLTLCCCVSLLGRHSCSGDVPLLANHATGNGTCVAGVLPFLALLRSGV